MRKIYLIRGLPGSGKSTLALSLVNKENHFEADQYFINEETGKYEYDASKIVEAHAYCQRMTREAMEKGQTPLAVSNIFVTRWEMDEYYVMALRYCYQVVEITMSGKLFPNVHDVPQEKIARMKEYWER